MARLPSLHAAFLTVSLALSAHPLGQDPAQAGKLKDRKAEQQKQEQQKEQEPPEEDEGSKEKEYGFNPLQAQKELRTGEFYAKKGNLKAAARRYREATKWDPTSAEAFYRLGQAEEKLKNDKASREAYGKYLELAPDGKEADAVRKKLARKP
ncbi:MAG: tetratricopeptide repeat protein [Acidobacteria bacterium]|nr:tetratricopeptide repeat protein [Acidobacteriota bacterium]